MSDLDRLRALLEHLDAAQQLRTSEAQRWQTRAENQVLSLSRWATGLLHAAEVELATRCHPQFIQIVRQREQR